MSKAVISKLGAAVLIVLLLYLGYRLLWTAVEPKI